MYDNTQIQRRSNSKNAMLEIAILFFVFFSLYVITICTYFDDDLGSVIEYLAKIPASGGWANFVFGVIQSGFTEIGRINFLPNLWNVTLITAPLLVYRIITILCVVAGCYAFGMFMYKLTSSYKIKLFSMLVIALFFQIYTNMHPYILGYAASIQIQVVALFISLILFIYYLEKNKKIYLVFSCLLFLFNIFIYETGFTFLPLYMMVALYVTRRLNKALVKTISFDIIFVSMILFVIYVKSNATLAYGGTAISLQTSQIIKTWIKQSVSAIPLTNMIFNGEIKSVVKLLQIQDIALAIAFVMLFLTIWKYTIEDKKLGAKSWFLIFLTGICFVILPAFLIALTQTYQIIVSPGRGHMPVYIEYFGVLMAMMALYKILEIWVLKRMFTRILLHIFRVILLVVLAFVVALNSAYARSQIEVVNGIFLYPRAALQSMLENGALNDIPKDAVVVNLKVFGTRLNPADYTRYYYSAYAGRAINAVNIEQFEQQILNAKEYDSAVIDCAGQPPLYVGNNDGKQDISFATIGRVNKVIFNKAENKIFYFLIDKIKLSVKAKAGTIEYLNYDTLNILTGDVRTQTIQLKDKDINARKDDFVMYDLNFKDADVIFNSFSLGTFKTQNETSYVKYELNDEVMFNNDTVCRGINMKKGWSVLENWGRWGVGKTSSMILNFNDANRDLMMRLEATGFNTQNGKQVEVFFNDHSLGNINLKDAQDTYELNIPKEYIKSGLVAVQYITFTIENTSRPSDVLVGSTDNRELGIGLVSLVIK